MSMNRKPINQRELIDSEKNTKPTKAETRKLQVLVIIVGRILVDDKLKAFE